MRGGIHGQGRFPATRQQRPLWIESAQSPPHRYKDIHDVTGKEEIRHWFSRMVKDNMNVLYGVALHLTGNSANAEDLVAETVIKAWAGIGKLDDRARFRPWVLRILRNEFISSYRKASIRPLEVPFTEVPADDDDGSVSSLLLEQSDDFLKWWANPELALINDFLGEQIREAIDQLPEVYRMTILMINVDGLSYDEASVVLGVPFGTIRSRMKRGRTLLQTALWKEAQEAGLITASKN
jgi:RNA polymerase sigma-70 factor (ECF subfamily)